MRRQLLLLLGCLVAALLHLASPAVALPAQPGVLKRKRRAARKGDARLLSERQDYVAAATQRYLSNSELGEWLQAFEKRCKSIAKLHTIGTSGQGRPIWALEISDRPGQEEAEPAVKYVGNVHGDEPTGRVLTLALAEWLCAHYKSEPRAKRIVSSLHLWLVPTMNPDGFEKRERGNGAGKDLNRDFPDRFGPGEMRASGEEQPETAAMMQWSLRTGFVASASMHEGALVANYPWDGTADKSTRYEASPDDATFRHLASVYATAHRRMALPTNPEFPNGGITNGAAWYPIYGSMQDWNYIVGSCYELTLELSPNKWPAEAGLTELWQDNKDALLAFPLVAAYGGVWGTVREEGKLRANKAAEQAPLGDVNITVVGVDKIVMSHPLRGDFYRPLAPGRYTLLVSKPGFKPLVHNVSVPADGSGVQRHFVLARDDAPGDSSVATRLKGLAREAAASASSSTGGAAAGALPWQGSRKAGPDSSAAAGSDGLTVDGVMVRRGRDRLLLLASGAGVVYGLWITHSRLTKRTHPRRA